MTDLIWLPCDFEGCKRQENGDCTHCGFHAGEMELHRAIGMADIADEIEAKYTKPAKDR